MIRFFIGYDKDEVVAYHALVQSIIKHCSVPFSVTPLVRGTLPVGERDAKASTDFADTRFLVPWLCDYKGWALFMDCDMIFTSDPLELLEMQDDDCEVMVRQHFHVPSSRTKFLGQAQYKYSMKNWSSLMLFNCAKCKTLTPEYVDETPGLDLHQFRWTKNGAQPFPKCLEWNHLVGEHKYGGEGDVPKLIHYTKGGPYFNDYKDCEYAKEWLDIHAEMNYVRQPLD